jgi:hypothetical protein
MIESKRIRRLKSKLIKELPFFPNNKETLSDLESQGVNGILVHYLHWKMRLVYPRPRKVQIAPEVTSDKRWQVLKSDINSLLKMIHEGRDVSPYLSKKAHTYSYTPMHRIDDGKAGKWEDKDFVLNTKGLHHFHLNMMLENSGLSKRTNDVLLAYVSRDDFHAIGIFDHSIFDSPSLDKEMSSESERMWRLHEKHTSVGMEPGTVYVSYPITTSGHPLHIMEMSSHYAGIILNFDKKLDDREFVNEIYGQTPFSAPEKFSFEWSIEAHDLCIIDKKTQARFIFHSGHI